MTAFAQRAFSAGEIAPALYARVDNARYATGLRTCRNFLVKRHGGVDNRPGTQYIARTRDSGEVVRLIPFIFNSDQTYVLEFGNGYIRFIRNDAQIEVSGVPTWDNGTAYDVGDLVVYDGVNYYCQVAHTGHAPSAPSNTWWYAMTGNVFEIPTPYSNADLANIQFVQSADVITLVHPSYAPRELRRYGHTTWTLTTLAFGSAQADVTNLTQNGGVPGAIATSWTVTAVGITGEESDGVAVSSSSAPSGGSPILLQWTAAADAVEYRVYREFDASGTLGTGLVGVVTGTVFSDGGDIPSEVGSPPIDPGLFQSTGDYPSTVIYSQQRRIFANTDNDPETVWCSRVGSYSNFSSRFPTLDDDPVTFTLVGKQVNEIRHLLELRQLLALTDRKSVV